MLLNLMSHMLGTAGGPLPASSDPIVSDQQLLAVIAIAAAPMIIIGLTILIGLNRRRYLATTPSLAWLTPGYVRNLPNILKTVYDATAETPWPKRPTSLHAALFRRRLRKMLRERYADAKALADQHLSLWVFIELHRGDLRELVLKRKIVRLRGLLLNTPDEHLRARLLARINRCREQLDKVKQLTPAPLRAVDSALWFKRLHALSAIFAEHGYQIDPALTELEHWQYTCDEELLAELVTDDAAVALS